jgi:hypothetical protein
MEESNLLRATITSPPGKELPVHTGQEAGWDPESVRMQWQIDAFTDSARNWAPVMQPIA